MAATPRLALCLEQTLGHRAHALNIEAAAADTALAVSDVLPIEYAEDARLPVPWAVRGSRRARAALRARPRYDAVLFHTQTISLMAPEAVRGAPYVVSVDATPKQVDTMGRWYRHRRGPALLESAKAACYRRVLHRAAAVVAWSAWAADSLARDYGVAPGRDTVAHPGAGRHFFAIEHDPSPRRTPRILFVGGDFERKGGHDLLAAFEPLADRAELVLVTEAEVAPRPGVTVLRGIRPGTDAQLRAFAEADLFCLPTHGDCTPVAIGEAMAAGLPVVTTTVGSNAESVPGEAGRLVAPGDVPALRAALEELVDDPAARRHSAAAARAHAAAAMDAGANARRIIELLRSVA